MQSASSLTPVSTATRRPRLNIEPSAHLVVRGSAVHFRFVIPKALRALLGQREIRRSMPPARPRDLQRCAIVISSRLRHFFREVLVALSVEEQVDKDQVAKLMHAILDDELDMLRRETVRNVAGGTDEDVADWKGYLGSVAMTCAFKPFSRKSVEYGLGPIRQAFDASPGSRDHIEEGIVSLLGGIDTAAIASPHISCHNPSMTAAQREDQNKVLELAQAISVARGAAHAHAASDILVSEVTRAKAHEDLDDYYRRPVAAVPSPVLSHAPSTPSVMTIGGAIEKHLAETAGKGKAKTARERSARLMLFAEAIDTNKPLAELSAEMVLDFADLLRFLPARRADKYRDVPVLEFRSRASDLAVPATSLMAYKTRINVLTMLRVFVNWLPKRGHTSFDHAKYLSLTISEQMKALKKEYDQQGGSSRISFSDAELQALFVPGQYVAETEKYPERFWLPLLALYTGGRTQDLLTLRRRDIKVTPENPDIFHVKGGSLDEDTSRDGIPYIDLTDTMEKVLKTARANRVIPIHPFVWETLGFSRFIEAFSLDEFLFGKHIMDNGELSNSFGAWFTRYRRSVGVGRQKGDKASRDVVFHSFRHTVKRAFRLKQCNQSIVHEIIGHDDEKETATSMMYSGAFLIEQKLDEAIAQLDFHNKLPLADIASSRWTSGAKIVVKRTKRAAASS